MTSCKTTKQKLNHLSPRGEKILLAAQQLFLSHGYDNTSLAMIIEQAGGSRRSIYQEFDNKQGLLMAVMARQVNLQVNNLTGIDYHLPPQLALQSVCEKFLQGLLSETLLALFRLVTNLVSRFPELGEMVYDEGPIIGLTPVCDYLTYLEQQGVLVIEDKTFAAQMLIEMVKGRLHMRALLMPHIQASQAEIGEHVQQTVSLFLKAYQPDN